MRPADLLRRTSFRFVITMALFVLAALLLAGAVGYGLMHAQLTARQDARVTEIFASLEQTMLADDAQDLIEVVTARIAASPDHASVYLLKSASGQVLVGNIPDFTAKPGWSMADATQLGIVTDYPYRLFTGIVGAFSLTVGLSDGDLDDLRELVAAALGWAALAVLVAAIGVGWVLAHRMQHRLDRVDAALHLVAQGDLAARLPSTGQGDDLDRITQSINAALERLADVVTAMHTVSTDIAHDLRTPLNRLRIRIETASQKAGTGQSVVDDLAAAMAEGDQINETFTALLRIAQIEAADRRTQFQAVNLTALLQNLVALYAPVAEDAGMTLVAVNAPDAQIDGDPDLITQMLANLIENSIRHCPPGSMIECGLVQRTAQVVVRVADTGPGIPLAERSAVLRRLYRLERSRTTDGAGLGLSMVKAIVDLHHAALTLGDATQGAHVGLAVEIAFPRSL